MNESALPASPAAFDARALVALRRVAAVAASPCGTWAAVAVERLVQDGSKYACDLWRVPLDGEGAAVQLTRGKSRDSTPCFRADGALGFLSNRIDSDGEVDADAEKRNQVWLLPVGGGEPQRLTDEPLGVQAFRFASRNHCLAVLAPVLAGVPHDAQRSAAAERAKKGPSVLRYRSMPVRHWDHWLPEATPHLIAYDGDGGQRRDLTPDAGQAYRDAEFDIAPDGSRIAITHAALGSDRVHDVALRLVNVASGASRLLGAAPLTALSHPLFSPDGNAIACARESRPAPQCVRVDLQLIDLARERMTPLAAGWDRWPTPAAWSEDGRTLYATADEHGSTPVFAIDIGSDRVTPLTTGGTHAHVQVAVGGDGPMLVGTRSGILHPPEVFCLPLGGVRVTFPARLSGFDPQCVAVGIEELHVTSSDGRTVQTRLLKPAAHQPQDGPLPTLLWIHGGPMASWGDAWHWRWNPLLAVAQGYAVALPNPRGSTGFGQSFIDGIWGNQWGRQCYDDVMAVTDVLAARGDVDGGRMAAMGGSFGGYMTNWIGSQTDRFRCLVTHASVYSMFAFTGVTDLPAFWLLQMGGTPYGDLTEYERYSPSRGIANWKSPTLVIHGDLDYRVPVGESLALFEALQHHGVESELMVFPDENHWILKPNNTVAWYEGVFEFLGGYLGRRG